MQRPHRTGTGPRPQGLEMPQPIPVEDRRYDLT
jgi:hypothetical protein